MSQSFKPILVTLLVVFTINGFAQTMVKPGIDTIGVTACNSFKTLGNGYVVYRVSIVNFSNKPVCILHTATIDLSPLLPPQFLAVSTSKGEAELFTLNYGAGDTVYSHPPGAYKGAIILPLQKLEFELAMPRAVKARELAVEYFHLADFSYNAFVENIFKNSGSWYQKYQRKRIGINVAN